jgi:hypothetical protein
MPLVLDFEFYYPLQPTIAVSLSSIGQNLFFRTGAVIDTGAEISLFDLSIASRAGIDLTSARSVTIAGIAGDQLVAKTVPMTLRLLDEQDLELTQPVAFCDVGSRGIGNLIGLDVLEYFDFGLSHREHLGYLGRPS